MSKTATIEKPTRSWYEKRIGAMEAELRAVCNECHDLILAGETATPPNSAAAAARASADAVLRGVEVEPPAREAGNRLFQLEQRNSGLKDAIELGKSRLRQLLIDQSETIAKDLESAWRKNIRASAELIAQLQKLNDERHRLRNEWCARVGLDVWPGCHVEGDRMHTRAGPLEEFLERARFLNFLD